MRLILLSALSLAVLLPTTQAQGFRYTYLEAGFGTHDVDGGGDSGDVLGFGASVGLGDALFLTANSNTSTFDTGILGDMDVTHTSLGLGFHTAIGDGTDLVIQAEIVNMEVELLGVSADDDGIAFGGGLRIGISDSIELDIGYTQVEYDDSGSDSVVDAGARFNLGESLSIGVAAEFWDEGGDDVLMGSLRWYL
ncbi:MAG: outer membrane beta-barrel protein [Planctomycetota bacterium]|jgi:hypothetical protein|nr:outer membrane beta-barrel protein [Planctomycetota bacterium]